MLLLCHCTFHSGSEAACSLKDEARLQQLSHGFADDLASPATQAACASLAKVQSFINAHIHTDVHTCTHIDVHTRTDVYIYIYTYVFTYTDIYT